MTKTKIAVCIPMTSKKQNWTRIGDCFFLKIFLNLLLNPPTFFFYKSENK